MKEAFEKIFQIFSISAVRYFLIAGIAFVVFYVLLKTRAGKAKIQHKFSAKQDYKREIMYSLLMTAVASVIGYAVLYTPFVKYTLVYQNISDYPTWWIFVSLVLSLVIHDTYFYWMHRLLHHPKIFPYTHLVHHQSTNPSPFTSYSFHFFETVTENLVLVLIVMILPMHQISILLFVIIGFIINVYGHLGYEIAPKWLRKTFLFEIINTSVHHNLHHSKFKGNYGLYFRVWDRLMKTENPAYVKEYDRIQSNRFGNDLPNP